MLDEHPDKYRNMTFMQVLPHILTHAQVRAMSMEERERVFDQWKERNSVELIDEHRAREGVKQKLRTAISSGLVRQGQPDGEV